MPELQVDPQVLSDAAGSIAAERSALAQLAAALGPVLDGVAAALPGSRSAAVARQAGDALPAEARALADELSRLAGALGAAARDYATVEQVTAAGLERAGRRPV